ncbi:hypothetical protein Ancab_022239 [Ancistrocladus abbreviatus]
MSSRFFSWIPFFGSYNLRTALFCPLFFPSTRKYSVVSRRPSLLAFLSKGFVRNPPLEPFNGNQSVTFTGCAYIHSSMFLQEADKNVGPENQSESSSVIESADTKVKRKKLKGKRAVVRWLKFFRWKKKKDYQRMTAEEKILYKLSKARKKEERLVEALKKIEPKEFSETTHDPEILTPEEHFYFLKMGLKCKNYVPVGRRGIYQGVILNMHLHWKKHQTLKVIVKTFTPVEVKEIAAELARLSGGIILDIHEDNTIIMYRGKNYSQPPTEIMSPRVTLSRKKALDKSRYRDALRAVRRYIPRVEQELDLLHAQAKNKEENTSDLVENSDVNSTSIGLKGSSSSQLVHSDKLRELLARTSESSEDDSSSDLSIESDSEDLSDIFETESDGESEERAEQPIYLHTFEKFPVNISEPENFEEHLRQISSDANRPESSGKDPSMPELDEVDQLFLRAASLLKKKRR